MAILDNGYWQGQAYETHACTSRQEYAKLFALLVTNHTRELEVQAVSIKQSLFACFLRRSPTDDLVGFSHM